MPILATTTANVEKCELSAISFRMENIWRYISTNEPASLSKNLRSDDRCMQRQ